MWVPDAVGGLDGSDDGMTRVKEITLIRHGEVESKWRGICYGAMDVSLSQLGKQNSDEVAIELSREASPKIVYHSGLSRTRYLADRIAAGSSGTIHVREDARLRERNYGQWQGMTWDDAYATDPENFHGLIEAPDTYRPPGGETTSEMQRRVVDWFSEQDEQAHPIIAVSHSGPIAALAGYLLGLPATEWSPWMTKNLQAIQLTRSTDDSAKWTAEIHPARDKD